MCCPPTASSAAARPQPDIRNELRRIPRPAQRAHCAGLGLRPVLRRARHRFVAIENRWWGWVAAFLLVGRAHALYAILGHEAAHRLLFTRQAAPTTSWGHWLLAYPGLRPLRCLTAAGHMAHHRDELGPNEPDLNLYAKYPITRGSMRRKLRRDAFGNSG